MEKRIVKSMEIRRASCMAGLLIKEVEELYDIGIVPMNPGNAYLETIQAGKYAVTGQKKNVKSFEESKKWTY